MKLTQKHMDHYSKCIAKWQTYLTKLRATPYTAADEARQEPLSRQAAKIADAVAGEDDTLWSQTYHDELASAKFKIGFYSFDPAAATNL